MQQSIVSVLENDKDRDADSVPSVFEDTVDLARAPLPPPPPRAVLRAASRRHDHGTFLLSKAVETVSTVWCSAVTWSRRGSSREEQQGGAAGEHAEPASGSPARLTQPFIDLKWFAQQKGV